LQKLIFDLRKRQ